MLPGCTQALALAPATVATACPYCAVMLADGLAALDSNVPVRDIAELVAEALITEAVPETAAVAA